MKMFLFSEYKGGDEDMQKPWGLESTVATFPPVGHN